MKVLIVEDEKRIAADVAAALTGAGFVAETSGDGEDAWFRGDTEAFDVIVLDLGLPKLDGLSVLKRWRDGGLATPVIILTARDNWRDKVEGIDAGADDYLAKPFRIEELIARVRALARRAAGRASPLVAIGDFELDTRQQVVRVKGWPAALTALEYRLVAYLMLHAGRVVTQAELSDHIHDSAADRDSNAIEAIVARARRKLGAPLIETRRGQGYVVAAVQGASA